MKSVYPIMLFLTAFCGRSTAQLNNGGLHAHFGVDGDTKGGYLKYGPATGMISSDDWFSGVIDTSNSAYYRNLLQAGQNISFAKRMPVPLYTSVNGKIWLDAVYNRDYTINASAAIPVNDSTIFTGGSKNGDDPALWNGTTGWVPEKTDMVDVYAHMRRNGINVHDSLWFFTGVATMGVTGSRYFDIELYKNLVNYNRTSGTFNSGGTSAGHTQWLFDAAGNIIQTGDMIIAVSYSPGTVPLVEVRIWVSNTTYSTVTPTLFNFGGSFNGSTASFGYASIVSKSGATAFGSGMANYSATAAADTTDAAPWGSHGLSGSTPQWSAKYKSLQFVEVGLNLTRIGLDPALYSSVLNSGACRSSFSSIFFKSRSSPSFTSNLQDFVGPFDFLQVPTLDHMLSSSPFLTCASSSGNISVSNMTTAGYYTWSTADGNITATTANTVTVDKGGTYIMEASVAQGCPVTRRDTVKVEADTFPPVASFYSSSPDMTHYKLHGGNVEASDYATPFGRSHGLLWQWTGPRGFTSTIQNPVTDTASGVFTLVVTETRNGCTDTASYRIYMNPLADRSIHLEVDAGYEAVSLKWKIIDPDNARFFEIERSNNGGAFIILNKMQAPAGNSNTYYSFTDHNATAASYAYRIKMVLANGQIIYSNTVLVDNNKPARPFYLVRGSGESIQAVLQSAAAGHGRIVVYNLRGQVVLSKKLAIQAGQNRVELLLPAHQRRQPQVITLITDDGRRYSERFIYH